MDQGLAYKIRLSDQREFGPVAMPMILQWAREGRVPQDSMLVDLQSGEVRSVLDDPVLSRIIQAPPTINTGVVAAASSPPALIPYKNPAALTGYYLSVFSLVPIIGILCGIPAVILGVIGLLKRSNDPKIRGAVHAWIAIILGLLTTLGYGFALLAIITPH